MVLPLLTQAAGQQRELLGSPSTMHMHASTLHRLAGSQVPACAVALGAYRCHVIQSGLRPSGGTGYSIPRGFLFEYVTCANYCAEIYGWVAFTVGTQTVAPGIFILCGGAQMAIWAAGKHARLRKVGPGLNWLPEMMPWCCPWLG